MLRGNSTILFGAMWVRRGYDAEFTGDGGDTDFTGQNKMVDLSGGGRVALRGDSTIGGTTSMRVDVVAPESERPLMSSATEPLDAVGGIEAARDYWRPSVSRISDSMSAERDLGADSSPGIRWRPSGGALQT